MNAPNSYFIFAGLTFTPLVQPYLHEWGDDWYVCGSAGRCGSRADFNLYALHRFNSSPRKLSIQAQHGVATYPGEQVVVLSGVLVDQINYEFQSIVQTQVSSVNGVRVRNLRHLKHIVVNSTSRFLRFDMENDLYVGLEPAFLHVTTANPSPPPSLPLS